MSGKGGSHPGEQGKPDCFQNINNTDAFPGEIASFLFENTAKALHVRPYVIPRVTSGHDLAAGVIEQTTAGHTASPENRGSSTFSMETGGGGTTGEGTILAIGAPALMVCTSPPSLHCFH
jgi:hypothetical protein